MAFQKGDIVAIYDPKQCKMVPVCILEVIPQNGRTEYLITGHSKQTGNVSHASITHDFLKKNGFKDNSSSAYDYFDRGNLHLCKEDDGCVWTARIDGVNDRPPVAYIDELQRLIENYNDKIGDISLSV